MALRWLEGFDHYGTTPNGGRNAMLAGAWAEFASQNIPVITAAQSRTSGFSLLCAGNNNNQIGHNFARRLFGANLSQYGFGCAVYMAAIPSVNGVLGFSFQTTTNARNITFCFQSDGTIQVFVGPSGGEGGTLIATSAQVMTALAWNHVEVYVSHSSTVGVVEVRVNGVTVISITGANTSNLLASSVVLGNVRTNINIVTSPSIYYDDLTFWDTTGPRNNTFLGPQKVVLNMLDADTEVADWTVVGAASGRAAISEVPPNADTSYITADLAGATSEFTVQPLDENVVGVTGIYLPTMMRQSQPGVTWVQQGMVTDGAFGAGIDRPITEAYTYWGDVIEVNPSTGLPYTRAQYNSSRRRFVKTV